MQVSEFFELENRLSKPTELTGHLVLVNNKLTLIDSSEINHFKNANGVVVNKQDIKYVLRDLLLPLGGESSIFHKAKLYGTIDSVQDSSINIQKMKVQERGDTDWLDVDLSATHIEHCKIKHKPDESFDFFKEMGD